MRVHTETVYYPRSTQPATELYVERLWDDESGYTFHVMDGQCSIDSSYSQEAAIRMCKSYAEEWLE